MIAKRALFELAQALEGVPVLGALASSPAARAGVRYGDVLISVNGKRTRNVTDYIEAKSLRVEGMEIVVFRGGVETKRELTFDTRSGPPDVASILAELITLRVGEIMEEPDDKDPAGPS